MEKFMVEASKMNLKTNDQFKKTWFINGLKKEYAKHIDLMPTDDLDVIEASTQKIGARPVKKNKIPQ